MSIRDEHGNGMQAFDLNPAPPFDPSLLATPQYQDQDLEAGGEEEAVDPVEEARRWRERAEQLEAESNADRQRREELEAERERREAIEAERARQEWERAEKQARAHAETLPFKEGLDYLDNFRRSREAQLYQWGQGLYSEKQIAEFQRQAEKIVRDEGLSESEVDALVQAAKASGDARTMKAEAKRIKERTEASTREVRELREKLERMEAERNRERLAASPVNRVGQGGGRAANGKKVAPGTREHLRELLGNV